MYTELRYEVDGDIGVITLNRPEARNALTFTTYAELEDAVRRATARVLVITGAGSCLLLGRRRSARDGGGRRASAGSRRSSGG